MRSVLLAASLLACGNDKATTPSTPATAPTPAAPKVAVPAAPRAAADPAPPAPEVKPTAPVVPAGGHDFTAEGKALLVVGACGAGTSPDTVPAKLLEKHCAVVKKAQADYS